MTAFPNQDPRDNEAEVFPGTPPEVTDKPTTGRRDAHKRATRAAIRAAADRLIAKQGFDATTVRQIADEAEVTERTFYRYFDGKEGLVASEMTASMEAVHEAILGRPSAEGPVEAVRSALLQIVEPIESSPRAEILWSFTDNPAALKSMRRSGVRPLLRFEELITRALLERREDDGNGERPDRFTCELIARVAVSILRTIGNERRRLKQDAPAVAPSAQIRRGFEAISRLFAETQQS